MTSCRSPTTCTPQERLNPSLEELLSAPVQRFTFNARLLIAIFKGTQQAILQTGLTTLNGVGYLEVVSLGLMLAGVPLTTIAMIRKPHDHPLLVGGLAVLCALLLAILALYFVRYFQALRILLIGVPFECIASAILLSSVWRAPRKVSYLAVALIVAVNVSLMVAALRPTASERAESQRDLAFMQSIRHDDRFVL